MSQDHNFIPDADDSLAGMSQEVQVCSCGFLMLGVYPGISVERRRESWQQHMLGRFGNSMCHQTAKDMLTQIGR